MDLFFAGITQSFLEALNNGAAPTITSSWQSVEEYAIEVFKSSFDRTRPHEEAVLRETYEEAIQKAMTAFKLVIVLNSGLWYPRPIISRVSYLQVLESSLF